MRRFLLLSLVLLVVGTACETREAPRGDSSSGASAAQRVRPERKDDESVAACGTLREVVPSDLVAVDGDLVYQVDETEGLSVTSLADPARPRTLARVPFVGTPLAFHFRAPLAWIAYVDWRVPGAATIVSVIDVGRPDELRVIGTTSRPGMATGTALVGGVLYLMNAKGGGTSIAAYRAADGALAFADELSLDGDPGALAASPAGLAAITSTRDGISVSWIDLANDRPGAMNVRGTRRLDGGFPAWERDVVSADEGQAVRFLACATTACRIEEDAVVRVVDFARGGDEIRATLPLRIGGGVPVVRFADDRLYVADIGTLSVVDLHPTPRVAGSIALSGTIAALRAYGTHVIAVGSVGTPASGIKVAVHDVDVRVPSFPRLRGTVTFGEDWTWSRAADDDRAISLDPSNGLVALPFSTWRASDGRYATGAQVLALGRRAPALRETLPADGHVERVLFVNGRVVAVGAGAVTVLERAADRELDVW